jgi:hypothetical protein
MDDDLIYFLIELECTDNEIIFRNSFSDQSGGMGSVIKCSALFELLRQKSQCRI